VTIWELDGMRKLAYASHIDENYVSGWGDELIT
jgi:hypothetical protein